MNWKVRGRKWSRSIVRCYTETCQEVLRKTFCQDSRLPVRYMNLYAHLNCLGIRRANLVKLMSLELPKSLPLHQHRSCVNIVLGKLCATGFRNMAEDASTKFSKNRLSSFSSGGYDFPVTGSNNDHCSGSVGQHSNYGTVSS